MLRAQLILGFLLATSTLFHALATTFNPQPFSKTVRDAPVIVRGKVGMSYADWGKDPEGIKRLYTYYELQVAEVLKGIASRPTLVMREMGGEKDGIGLQIPGASHYDRGEDVVVLLKEKNSEGSYDVQGLMMGKYNVQTDSEGVDYLEGAGLFGDHPDQHEPTLPLTSSKWTLDGLRSLIQTQMHDDESTSPLQKGPSAHPTQPPLPLNPLTAHSRTTAPQLQPIEREKSSLPKDWGWYFGFGFGLVGVLGLFRLLNRKK